MNRVLTSVLAALAVSTTAAWGADPAAEAEVPKRSFRPSIPAATPAAEQPAEAQLPSQLPKPARALPKAEPAKPDEIPGLIASLNSRNSAVRQSAAARLAATGKPALEEISKAARSDSLEVRVRAVMILREIYVSGDDQSGDAAEAILTTLSSERNPSVAGRADQILSTNYDISEKRALNEIRRLGGIINYLDEGFVDPNGLVREGKMLSHIILGKTWTGGDEGLRHVKRLSKLTTLYYIGDAGLTEGGLKELQASVPNLRVERRGRACLGVSCMDDGGGGGCQVYRIVEGSAADKAKFRIGDSIVSFDGKPVTDFKALIEMIGKTNPGDKIKIGVQRDFQRVALETIMDEWK